MPSEVEETSFLNAAERPNASRRVRVRREAVERVVVIARIDRRRWRRGHRLDLRGERFEVRGDQRLRHPARQLEERGRPDLGITGADEARAIGGDLGGAAPHEQPELDRARHERAADILDRGGDRHRDAEVIVRRVAELVPEHEAKLGGREVLDEPRRERDDQRAGAATRTERVVAGIGPEKDLDGAIEAEPLATFRERL